MATDAIFRISSMTKPVTAVATLSCVEDGLFRLDEPVDRLLPELADRSVLEHQDAPLGWVVPAERPILVRDLLTFTMGLGIVMAPPGEVPLADALVELELGQGPPSPQGPPAARRVDPPPRHPPPAPPARRAVALRHRLRRARRADRPGHRPPLRRGAPRSGCSTRSACTTPGSSVGPDRVHRLVPAYATDPATGELEEYDPPDRGRGAGRRPSLGRRPAWCRPPTTWSPSAGCCWPAAAAPTGAG